MQHLPFSVEIATFLSWTHRASTTIWKQHPQQLGLNLTHQKNKWAGLPQPQSFVWRIIGLLFAMFHLAAVHSLLRGWGVCAFCLSPCGSSSLQGSSRGPWWLHLSSSQSIHLTLLRSFFVSSMAVGPGEINRAPSWQCFVGQISSVNYLESLDQQAHASWPSCWTHHGTVFLMSHKGTDKFDFPQNLCLLEGKSAEQLNWCQRMQKHTGHVFVCLLFFTVYICSDYSH